MTFFPFLTPRLLCIADRTITAFAGRRRIFARRTRLLLRQRKKTGRAQIDSDWHKHRGPTRSTPGASKTFQPQRCGLISITVIASGRALHRLP
jgi:hypothetical protein